MDVSDHTILLFLGIADGNIEDQRLEQIHFGAVPEVIAFLATGILDDDVTKTSRIRYKTDNPEALICLLSGRPPVRVWSGVPVSRRTVEFCGSLSIRPTPQRERNPL